MRVIVNSDLSSGFSQLGDGLLPRHGPGPQARPAPQHRQEHRGEQERSRGPGEALADQSEAFMALILYIIIRVDLTGQIRGLYRSHPTYQRPSLISTDQSEAFIDIFFQGDSERKHGMEEFIGADPITFDHALLFKRLQSFSLEWRLHDPYSSLVCRH